MLLKIAASADAGLLLSSLAGCGGDDAPAAAEPASASSSAAPSETATSATSALEGLDFPEAICTAVTVDNLARALGTTGEITKEKTGTTSCSFRVTGAPISITLDDSYDPAAGLTTVRGAYKDLYGGDIEAVPGAVKPAFVVLGTVEENPEIAAAGAVLRGDFVSSFQVIQLAGLTADELRPGSQRIARLLASF